jgi:hypothetical protein
MTKLPKTQPQSGSDDEPSSAHHSWRQYVRAIGPGLISGACDDDPSGIATYAQARTQFPVSPTPIFGLGNRFSIP